MLELFKNILGQQNVIFNNESINPEYTTFETDKQVLGIIYPETKIEVQECIKVANAHQIKIYPISTGKNIGFGGAVPTDNLCIIMNLSKMNSIIAFNEEMAYVTIEPGVTQAQLTKFLEDKKSTLMLSVTGSLPNTSIIGNCLERGHTAGPLVERVENICNLGIILPCGNYIKTGYGNFDNSKAKNVHKFGLGPDISGLFIQSNLGVVVELTLWLSTKEKALDVIMFNTKTQQQLENTLDKIRMLKQQSVTDDNVFLWNDYKVVSIINRYPDEITIDKSLLSDWFSNLKKKHLIEEWSGIITLRSHSYIINELNKYHILKLLSDSTHSIISTKGIKFLIITIFKKFIEKLLNIKLKFLFNAAKSPLFKGKPQSLSFASIFWRKPQKYYNTLSEDILNNPERHKVGFIWCDVVLPLVGKKIATTVTNVDSILKQHSFEPMLGILCTSKRHVLLVIGITYDREILGEDKKAMLCHDFLLDHLIKQGYYPSRLGLQSMDKICNPDINYTKFIEVLKKTIDPNDILSPGRYDFRNNWKR